ncbi:VOC family protein [Yunchengibacter salinarum]|uniref:VOC family protein n=1 Tax=Yunchengibacter salinarum TaxID=3133399 RepID=UPI0035B59EB6
MPETADTRTLESRCPFHLAVPVNDLAAARRFYGDLLGCPEGRSSETWVDFDFFGHQLVVHLGTPLGQPDRNEVDGDAVPGFHFGAVLPWARWQSLAAHLEAHGVRFIIPPRIRFEGAPGEQATLFFRDPAGNALELKAFRNPGQLFAR